MTYVRLDASLLVIERFGIELTAPEFAALQANGKASSLRLWVIDAQPVPSATQVVIDAGYVIEATQARKTWTLRNKTQAELDAEQQAADLVVLKALVTALNADIAAGITAAPTTAAQAFVEIQDLKRRAL